MIDNLDDFLAEYDQIAYDVQTARRAFFETRLARLFAFLTDEDDNVRSHVEALRRRYPMDRIQSEVLFKREGMGDDIIKLPPDHLDQLSVHLNLFGAMAEGQLSSEKFSVQYFQSSERNLEIILRNMADGFFEPFVKELRRYIRKNYDEDPPDVDVTTAPASDRVVAINHNSVDYKEANADIARLIELLRAANDYDDPDDKAQRIAELEASQTLLKAPKVRTSALKTLLLDCLAYLGKKLGDGAASELAKRLAAFVMGWLLP
jgi:hypothetical protein